MSLQIRLTECIYVTIDKKLFNSNNNILLSTLHGYISCYACIKINSMANLTFVQIIIIVTYTFEYNN